MKMKDLMRLLVFLSCSTLLPAQEGFWSIDQLPQLRSKLVDSGLSIPADHLNPAQQKGLAHTTIRFPYGNGFFLNQEGLVLGLISSALIPDSIGRLMDARQGVWIAPAGLEIALPGFPAEVYLNSTQSKINIPSLGQDSPLKTYETLSDGSIQTVETHDAGLNGQQLFEQTYQRYKQVQLLAAIRLTDPLDAFKVAVILRVLPSIDGPEQKSTTNKGPNAFIPLGAFDASKTQHLILGHPQSSSIHRMSFELSYALELAKCHQDLDRALGAYITRPPFITQEGVFRQYEDINTLKEVLPKRAILEAEFRHQLGLHPALKARYGSLLDSCQVAFQDVMRYVPAQVYTKGIIYSPSSFFEAVRLFTIWRGKMGTSTHRMPTPEESQYFPEVFTRIPATENELLLPELLERYFSKLPVEHLAPYAIRQAVYANKDYARMSETLLIKSKFSQPEQINTLLQEDFLQNIDLISLDPAVQLVDSILQHYAEKVAPKLEKARQKAFRKADELSAAMQVVLGTYPGYPDADQSLRISYGTLLNSNDAQPDYLLSNAHVLAEQFGCPVIDEQGKLIGMVQGLAPGAETNAYYYHPEKSRALIWSITAIRKRIQMHPLGAKLLLEWK